MMKRAGALKGLLLVLLCIVLVVGCENRETEEKEVRNKKEEETVLPDEGEIFMFDGDRTCIDNSVMLPLMVGTWEGSEATNVGWNGMGVIAPSKEESTLTEAGKGYRLCYEEDERLTLWIGESMVLQTTASYTHLEPGGPCNEEIRPEESLLVDENGTSYGELHSLWFEMTETENRMVLELYEKPKSFARTKIVLKKKD